MFDNHIYNLFMQMTQEHKSLWRIKKFYKKDAKNCQICKRFWAKLEKEKHSHVKELGQLIKKHIKQNKSY